MIRKLERGTDLSWLSNPPTLQLTIDRDVTSNIFYVYEKHRVFATTDQIYADVDNESWGDIGMLAEAYIYLVAAPWVIYELDVCPRCNDISDEGEITPYNRPNVFFLFTQDNESFNHQ